MSVEFKVGDRVAVYGSSLLGTFLGKNTPRRTGVFVKTGGTEFVFVRLDGTERNSDGHNYITVHRRQCRRLRKKERRQVYVLFRASGAVAGFNLAEPKFDNIDAAGDYTVHYREVRKK